MQTLITLRNNLILAEQDYKTADSSLDSSPLQVIVCKESLKQARFLWLKGCEEYTKEHFFGEKVIQLGEIEA